MVSSFLSLVCINFLNPDSHQIAKRGFYFPQATVEKKKSHFFKKKYNLVVVHYEGKEITARLRLFVSFAAGDLAPSLSQSHASLL